MGIIRAFCILTFYKQGPQTKNNERYIYTLVVFIEGYFEVFKGIVLILARPGAGRGAFMALSLIELQVETPKKMKQKQFRIDT